jgi:hypothetical protein
MNDWNKAFRELSAGGWEDGGRLVLPTPSGVLPTKKVIVEQAKATGRLMSKTLRDNLKKKMVKTLQEFVDKKKTPYETKRGELRGKMNPALIDAFEEKIREAFLGYTKKDARVGMPPNIHTIAVTEMRSAVNLAKRNYADKLKANNPHLKLYKRWRHNNWLVMEPRPGHQKLNGKELPYNKPFDVEVYKKVRGRYIRTGSVKMMHPHDGSAPLSEVVNCQCDFEVYAKRKV